MAMFSEPHYDPGSCANCDSFAVTLNAPVYCSSRCRQAAELVRYVRACRRDGRDELPDVKEAIQIRTAMVLGGGYAERERRVPPEIREIVFRRSGGLCESCGQLMDFDRSTGNAGAVATIQHVVGCSNDASNLKAFCRGCNMGDAKKKFVAVEPGSNEAKLAKELGVRWSSPVPLRLCDDDQQWSRIYNQLARSAKAVIQERGEFDDDDTGDEDLPGFLGWTRQGTPIQEF